MSHDHALIDKALAGQAEAYEELVRRYQNRLFNTLVHITGCRSEAEDVTQEAFTQAFVKLSSFRRDSQFYTWLYRIAYNRWVSRQRKKRPTSSLEHRQQDHGFEPVDPRQSAEEMMEQRDDLRVLQSALRQLPEEFRQVLVLRELEGRSYDEIADLAELPVGTVRSRLHRARKQLLEAIKKEHPSMFATE